ncbi:MAG: mitochondrial fission ELM1 family protein [Hyphomicrobiales bacterium]
MHIWVLTDGKAGDVLPCRGIANKLAALMMKDRVKAQITERVVNPSKPWVWLMPFGPIDPAEKSTKPNSPLAPDYPDVAIASGRRAVPYLKKLKRMAPNCVTVFIKDPRTGTGAADIIWVPSHDKLRGHNVLVSDTGPHHIEQGDLNKRRAIPHKDLFPLPEPRLTILLGGPSGQTRYTDTDLAVLRSQVSNLARQAGSVLITTSRRTPDNWLENFSHIIGDKPSLVWTPQSPEPNPYIEFLAAGNALVVTGDSHNMIGEALCAGVAVYVFTPQKLAPKLQRFTKRLFAQKLAIPLGETEGQALELTQQNPIDSSAIIIEQIRKRILAPDST